MSASVYLVEDHSVMRQGYAALVNEQRELTICGETGSAAEARREIPELAPDLAIVDLSLEDGNGLELVKELQSQCPPLKILIVSMHDETLYAPRSLEAGAEGYLSKQEPSEKVIEAIRHILDGRLYFSEEVNEQLMHRYLNSESDRSSSLLNELSDRELEVFRHIGQGLTTRETAEKLQLSPKTIGTYRSRIKEKLVIDTNAELRRRAVIWVELSNC